MRVLRIPRGLGALVGLLCAVSFLFAEDRGQRIDTLLAAKDFQAATEQVQRIPGDRDALFGRIALAQAAAGDTSSAKESLRRIQDVGTLQSATVDIARQAAGGAVGADFDTLINLITSTVAPNSWDDVGGPGAIQEFPGGIDVDARGVMTLARRDANPTLAAKRQAAARGNSHQDPRRRSALRMVSLPRLFREVQLMAAFGEAPTNTMRHLAGIREIQYVFVYPETGDLVIAGPAGEWDTDREGFIVGDDGRPVVLLEHLLALVKMTMSSEGRFGCSIDPKPERLAETKHFLEQPTGALSPRRTPRWVNEIREHLGLQNVSIHGVDPESHVARLLVEADYHMKLVGMGLEPSVAEVPSYLDSIDAKSVPKSMDVLRWWFTLRTDAIRRDQDGNAFEFAGQTVQLQSENERLTNRGSRVQTGRATPLNQQFAQRFTRHYSKLAEKYTVYQQLENVFRLALVAAIMHDETIQARIDWNPDWITSHIRLSKGAVPREVASIVNHRVINRRHVVVGVSGGVSLNAMKSLNHAALTKNASLVQRRRATAKPMATRDSQQWWWD